MILYFSATGNTLWAVEQIQAATRDRVMPMTVTDEDVEVTLEEGERLGFFFPVHGWRPPLLVRRFISRLKVNNLADHYVYALCTAGDTVGEALDILSADLQKQGVHLTTSASLLMPESYIGLPFMDVDTVEREGEKIESSQIRFNGMIDDIIHCRPFRYRPDIGRWPRINSRVIGAFFTAKLVTDRPFHVDATKCLKCGKCVDACPVGDIRGGKGCVPEWIHNGHCLTCFACFHHCPVHAIDYGIRTKHKGQYYFGKNKV